MESTARWLGGSDMVEMERDKGMGWCASGAQIYIFLSATNWSFDPGDQEISIDTCMAKVWLTTWYLVVVLHLCPLH